VGGEVVGPLVLARGIMQVMGMMVELRALEASKSAPSVSVTVPGHDFLVWEFSGVRMVMVWGFPEIMIAIWLVSRQSPIPKMATMAMLMIMTMGMMVMLVRMSINIVMTVMTMVVPTAMFMIVMMMTMMVHMLFVMMVEMTARAVISIQMRMLCTGNCQHEEKNRQNSQPTCHGI
jgi:hypothetical protein